MSSGSNLEKKKHFVLIHGYQASPGLNYHSWLGAELEKLGHSVQIPALPNTKSPDPKEQAEYVLKNCEINKETVLVGHSLGGNVVLRVLEQLKSPVAATVLVGGFVDDNFLKERTRLIRFDFDFDISKIKQNAGSILLLHGKNEETISNEQFENLQKILGGKPFLVEDIREHFRSREEPAILKIISML